MGLLEIHLYLDALAVLDLIDPVPLAYSYQVAGTAASALILPYIRVRLGVGMPFQTMGPTRVCRIVPKKVVCWAGVTIIRCPGLQQSLLPL